MISPELRNKFKFKKSLKDIKSEYILAAGKFNYYLECQNPEEIIQISKLYGHNNCIAEVSQKLTHINCFFDYDNKESVLSQQEQLDLKQYLKQKIQNVFQQLQVFFYIKDASNNLQTSLHFILRLYTHDNLPIYFRNKTQIDQFFKFLNLQKPFDVDAFKGFCLRTLYADKYNNESKLQQRPFQKSFMSDQQNDVQSLVCYCPYSNESFYIDDYVKRQFVLSFVHQMGFEKEYTLSSVVQRQQDNHLSLQLTEKRCHNREHMSNNCVCMLFYDNITIKCHDDECKSLMRSIENKVFIINEVEEAQGQLTQSQPKISQEQRNVMNAHNQISLTKEQTGSDIKSITQLEKGGFKALVKHPEFSGLDQELRDLIGENGIVKHCVGGKIVEFAQSQKLQQALQKLDKTYNQGEIQNVINVYNQYNININVQQNFYNNQDDLVSGKTLTELYNNCVEKLYINGLSDTYTNDVTENIADFVIRGAKNQCIKNLISIHQKKRFIFCGKDQLYYYDKNNNKWQCENGVNIGLNDLKDLICNFLKQMQKVLELNSDKISLNLHKKIQDTTLKQTENLQYQTYLYLLQIDNHEFNVYNHLIHFQKSTYDLLQKKFISNRIDYFNTYAIKFQLDLQIIDKLQNQISYLHQIIDDILPNQVVKKWFLQSIAQNLIGVSKQKPIIFMKGTGSNGKSFLIQLIRNSLGPYCYKGQSSMFQKDTIQDSSKSTGTTGDAISSRICYIEEISSNMINIEKLKELTGGGTVPTRKLHQDFIEQEIRCQFYVACNNLPNFGRQVDQAVKNRIVAIPFDTEFVEHPVESYQRKKIENIVDMAKNITYQQAFISILLNSLHEQSIQIPQEILLFTQEMKDDIDPVQEFFISYFTITDDQEKFITREDFVNTYNLAMNPPHRLKSQSVKDPIFKSFENYLSAKNSLNTKENKKITINNRNKWTKIYYGVTINQQI